MTGTPAVRAREAALVIAASAAVERWPIPARTPREVWCGRQLWRAMWADAPSPLESVLGPERSRPALLRAEGFWAMAVATLGLVAVLLPHPPLADLRTPTAVGVLVAVILIGAGCVWKAEAFSDLASNALVGLAVGGIPLVVLLVGPGLQVGTAAIVASGISMFVFERRRVATLGCLGLAAGYALVLGTQPGYPAPFQRWLLVVGCMVASSVALAWLVGIVEQLAVQEREGRARLAEAHLQLAELNDRLARRVDDQVEEICALNRLKRFLSPQIAEAVLADGTGACLEPHRQRIAVVFCDLRGFTSFASAVAPEEVMDVLRTYFATVGELVRRYDATVGTFAGDGVMAYFGDPVPHEDPAGAAVAMAVELSRPMHDLVERWRRRGFDLGYGVGIAYGYATMGTIGFESRSEYTPLGPVVNLASRLCGVAADGEILIDDVARAAVFDRIESDERRVELRGYRAPVAAHRVLDWLPTSDRADLDARLAV